MKIPDYDYGQLAHQIRDHIPYGLNYTLLGPDPSVGVNPYRPPLYPFLLSFLTYVWQVQIMQLAFFAATVWMLRRSKLAVLVLLCHYSSWYWITRIEADTVFTFFVVTATMATMKCVE